MWKSALVRAVSLKSLAPVGRLRTTYSTARDAAVGDAGHSRSMVPSPCEIAASDGGGSTSRVARVFSGLVLAAPNAASA